MCGRNSTTGGCDGVTYTTGIEQYDQVCGRIIGYQIGITIAFYFGTLSIDSYYVVGVSVTHGSPRQHIWTFAAGLEEQPTYPCCTCPCVAGSWSTGGGHIPSFVGQNYFCESGLTHWPVTAGVFYPNGDPLWDGQGCGPTSSCCTLNSPPWFNTTLSSPTSDDIEVRICSFRDSQYDDAPIQLMELYVK